MTCSCRSLGWMTAMTLVLLGVVGAGCDSSPTEPDSDPGPEGPNEMTGTIGAEGGVVYGPDSSAVAAAAGTLPGEIGFEIQQVPLSEISVGSLPGDVPVAGDTAYSVSAEKGFTTKLDAPPAAVSIPIPDRLSPENLSVAVRHPRESGAEPPDSPTPPWHLQNGVLGEQNERLTISHQTFFPEGTEYILIRAQPTVFGKTPQGGSPGTNLAKDDSPGFYVECWDDTFNISNPCDRLEDKLQTLTESVLPEAREKIKDAGYGEPRIDRCPPRNEFVPDIGIQCQSKNGPYEITIVGEKSDKVSGGGYYSHKNASIYVKSEYKDNNGGYKERPSEDMYGSAAHELLHSYQYGEIGGVGRYKFDDQKHNWVKEGHAALAAKSLRTDKIIPSYLERGIYEAIDFPLKNNKFAYHTQDFWAFIAREAGPYGLGFSITHDIIEKVADRDVPSNWLPSVKTALLERFVPLSEAYWRWVRDQAYEGQVMGRNGMDACSPIYPSDIELSDGKLEEEHFGNHRALSARFQKIIPQWSPRAERDIFIRIRNEEDNDTDMLRAKTYVSSERQCEEAKRTGLRQKVEDVSGDETVFVLVANATPAVTQTQTSLEITVDVPSPNELETQSRNSSVEVRWEPPESPPSSFRNQYNVYRSTAPFDTLSEATPVGTDIAEPSFTDAALDNGTTYYYRVTAVDKAEEGSNLTFESDPTSQGEATPLPGPPDRP